MVKDKIAHYRLTKKIIETELLRMFPATSSTALEIRESADVFTFHIPEKLTQAQRNQILSKKIKDRQDDNW